MALLAIFAAVFGLVLGIAFLPAIVGFVLGVFGVQWSLRLDDSDPGPRERAWTRARSTGGEPTGVHRTRAQARRADEIVYYLKLTLMVIGGFGGAALGWWLFAVLPCMHSGFCTT